MIMTHISTPSTTAATTKLLLLRAVDVHLTAYYGAGGESDPLKPQIEAAVRAAYSSAEYTVQHITLTLTILPPTYFTRFFKVQPYEASEGGLTAVCAAGHCNDRLQHHLAGLLQR
jgi:hypothetical protein